VSLCNAKQQPLSGKRSTMGLATWDVYPTSWTARGEAAMIWRAPFFDLASGLFVPQLVTGGSGDR